MHSLQLLKKLSSLHYVNVILSDVKSLLKICRCKYVDVRRASEVSRKPGYVCNTCTEIIFLFLLDAQSHIIKRFISL